MPVNKVVFGAVAIMDISDSTVTPETLAEGATAYDKTGAKIEGTMKSGEDLSAELIAQDEIISELESAITNKAAGTVESPNIQPLSVTSNGTYTASGEVDGYSPIVVDVPEKKPVLTTLTATLNKTYTPPSGYDGYSSVTVNVPTSGGTGVAVYTQDVDIAESANSLSISGVPAEPLMFAIQWLHGEGSDDALEYGNTVQSIVYDGTNVTMRYRSLNSGIAINENSALWSYADGTLTIKSGNKITSPFFKSEYSYRLTYVA